MPPFRNRDVASASKFFSPSHFFMSLTEIYPVFDDSKIDYDTAAYWNL